MAVTEVEHQTEFDAPVTVYNIEVAEWHTYLVGKWQWWVHNATICLSKIAVKVGTAVVERVKGPFKLGPFNAAAKGSPDILTRRMQAAMGMAKPANHAAHHIAMKKARKAWTGAAKKGKLAVAATKKRLKKYGIDIDDANNGVYLPQGVGTGTNHRVIHTSDYAIDINERTRKAEKLGKTPDEKRDAILNELENIRVEMENGTYKGS